VPMLLLAVVVERDSRSVCTLSVPPDRRRYNHRRNRGA
jgi:hypothetical protein